MAKVLQVKSNNPLDNCSPTRERLSEFTLLPAAPPAGTSLPLSNPSSMADLSLGILGTPVFSPRGSCLPVCREKTHCHNRESDTDCSLPHPATPITGSSLPLLNPNRLIDQRCIESLWSLWVGSDREKGGDGHPWHPNPGSEIHLQTGPPGFPPGLSDRSLLPRG